jgi:ERCC4-type nuclease
VDPKSAKLWIEPSSEMKSGWIIKARGDVTSIGSGSQFIARVIEAAGISLDMDWDALVAKADRPAKRQKQRTDTSAPGYQAVRPNLHGNRSEGRAKEALELDISSIKMTTPVTIQVDHREPSTLLELLASHSMITVEIVSLDLGDIAIEDDSGNRLLIERKRCDASSNKTDFEVSVQDDGRLFDQSERLKMAAGASERQIIPVVILEGDVYANSTTMLCQQIDGAISFLSAIQRISVLPTYNHVHTAYVIAKLAGHFIGGLYTPVTLHKSKPKALFEQQRYALEALPGISTKVAELLLAEFGSVRRVMTASKEELLQVKGLGPKKVEAVIKLLDGVPA